MGTRICERLKYKIMNKIMNLIILSEGGEAKSLTLRKHKKKYDKVDVGLYSYGSCFSDGFNIGGVVQIGRYCSFGPNVRYIGANHPIRNASMSPFFYNRNFGGFEVRDVIRHDIKIGNDVWVGNNVTILSSVEFIGNGAVIGAGAVVSKNVPPYAIVTGVPATIQRYRFDSDIIESLEISQWWNLTPEEIMKFYEYIDCPKEFARCIIQARREFCNGK